MIAGEYQLRCQMRSDIVDHLPRLHQEACRPGVTVIELGVRSGNSTSAFLYAAEQNDGHVYSVDIDRAKLPWLGHARWTFMQGDDLDLADDLPDGVDVVFIDTSHHYGQTLAELDRYVPKVKAGGVVLLHDTELERPDGAPDQDPPFPVRKAIDEYCGKHDLIPEFVTGCHGLGVIRVG
jgi:predicted O-methyltransferase YrrM